MDVYSIITERIIEKLEQGTLLPGLPPALESLPSSPFKDPRTLPLPVRLSLGFYTSVPPA